MSLVSYYLQAAKESQWTFALWVRYLNKSIHRFGNDLTEVDAAAIIDSGQLEEWQKAILEMAMKKKSVIWEVVVSYSEPADTWRYREYVEDMRKKGLLDDVPDSSKKTKDIDVKVIIFNESNYSILLQQESNDFGNYWGLPSGMVTEGESGEIVAARTIKNDFNVKVDVAELPHVFSTRNGSKAIYAYFWEVDAATMHQIAAETNSKNGAQYKWGKLNELKKFDIQSESLKVMLLHYFKED